MLAERMMLHCGLATSDLKTTTGLLPPSKARPSVSCSNVEPRSSGMTLMQVALTLSIVASTLAIVASLCGFARFVRRWWMRKGPNAFVSLRPGQRNH